jgi:hypothetical protein
MCVHAGIAAADVICWARLGVHSEGQNHGDAISMLGRVDAQLANKLRALLDLKTKSGYGWAPTSSADKRKAGRSAVALDEAAEQI